MSTTVKTAKDEHGCKAKNHHCPIALTSKLIGDMWVLLIVRDLLNGPKRFNQFLTSLNEPDAEHKVSTKTLAQRLKMLEAHGLITRVVLPDAPIHIEYSLTTKGRALNDVIDTMRAYGEKFL